MSLTETDITNYHYNDTPIHTDSYLTPVVLSLLADIARPARIIDIGSGAGHTTNAIARQGFNVVGVEPSAQGVERARRDFPDCRFEQASAYDDLSGMGKFDAVVSLEVVEHLFLPRRYAKTIGDLLAPGGIAIISTPYHSYLKNLALSIFNKWDTHLDPLWDYGHVKLWSRATLARLFAEAGLRETDFRRVGRIPQLAKSMICVFRKVID